MGEIFYIFSPYVPRYVSVIQLHRQVLDLCTSAVSRLMLTNLIIPELSYGILQPEKRQTNDDRTH